MTPDTRPPRVEAADALTTRGRTARLIATALVFGVLLAGTIWGDEDQFPFGPFRMYATNEGPNAPVDDPRAEGVTADGTVIYLNEGNAGVRRAEIEGQLDRYVEQPSRLRALAEAYDRARPGADRLVEVRIIMRWHGVRDSRPTGTYTDHLVVRWTR